MRLAHFKIIVAVDSRGGIAKEGKIPWDSPEDRKFFREKTTESAGGKPNVVIMGRKTYESLPEKHRPLKDRINVVISTTWNAGELNSTMQVVPTLRSALTKYADTNQEIWIIGGEKVYQEAVRDYLYLCDEVYLSKITGDYQCDQFFPCKEVGFDWFVRRFGEVAAPESLPKLLVNVMEVKKSHPEQMVLDLYNKVLTQGERGPDRTGVGTVALCGESLKFDISERIPILTTRKINYEAGIKELLFFVSGKTDTKILEGQGVKFWVGNTTKEFLEKRGLKRKSPSDNLDAQGCTEYPSESKDLTTPDYREGDMGPGYGFQWRHWGAKYRGCDTDYTGEGIDQLQQVIDGIRKDPSGRRHIVSAWNVEELPLMALPPCHKDFQFVVKSNKLHCVMNQRSGDLALGVPLNILSYAILTHMVAHITGLIPGTLTVNLVDAHIYTNHIAGIKEQLQRTPLPWPTLKFHNPENLKEIDDFKLENFLLEGYQSWPHIKYEMAV